MNVQILWKEYFLGGFDCKFTINICTQLTVLLEVCPFSVFYFSVLNNITQCSKLLNINRELSMYLTPPSKFVFLIGITRYDTIFYMSEKNMQINVSNECSIDWENIIFLHGFRWLGLVFSSLWTFFKSSCVFLFSSNY